MILRIYQGQRYPYVKIRKQSINLHVLICSAFHGPCPTGKHEVAHWDDNPDNNVSENLRWATRRENIADYMRLHGGRSPNRGKGKITEEEAREIKELLSRGVAYRKVAKIMNVSTGLAWHIKAGDSWAWV